MDPELDYYTDPVVVLDYQSLYPSIMIAYNYCFSTCLGRLDEMVKAELVGDCVEDYFRFGCRVLFKCIGNWRYRYLVKEELVVEIVLCMYYIHVVG